MPLDKLLAGVAVLASARWGERAEVLELDDVDGHLVRHVVDDDREGDDHSDIFHYSLAKPALLSILKIRRPNHELPVT